MTLLNVFNTQLHQFIAVVVESFRDSRKIHDFSTKLNQDLTVDPGSPIWHKKFEQSTPQKVIDDLFKHDGDVFTTNEFFLEFDFDVLYNEMEEGERTIIWKHIEGLCKYSSMIRACGDQISEMEQLAVDFMANNADIAPEEYHTKLFKEMISGGELSKRLMKTFSNKKCIENILSNVSNIVKSNNSDGSDNIGDLFKSVLGADDIENIAEGFTKENAGENSIDDIMNNLQSAFMSNSISDMLKDGKKQPKSKGNFQTKQPKTDGKGNF
jgi:hypothetical protein